MGCDVRLFQIPIDCWNSNHITRIALRVLNSSPWNFKPVRPNINARCYVNTCEIGLNWTYVLKKRTSVNFFFTFENILPMTSLALQKYVPSTFSLRRNTETNEFNPLNAELNPTCQLLALLRAHHILHVSRIRVNNRQ